MHAASVAFAAAPSLTAHVGGAVTGLTIDAGYPPVQLPGVQTIGGAAMHSLSQPMLFSFEPVQSTYLVRGQIPDGAQQHETLAAALAHPDIVGVFSDPVIERSITCINDPAVGTDKTVVTRLSVSKLKMAKMTGAGVYLAIVDTTWLAQHAEQVCKGTFSDGPSRSHAGCSPQARVRPVGTSPRPRC